MISQENIAEIKPLTLSVIQSFLKKGEVHIGLKTYINKELRNDITEKMLLFPPSENDTLETWSRKIFGKEKFGMVFNYVEEYSNSFAEKAATIVSPLLALSGLPLEGISFLFFMGNYGFTPFGVHKEAVGEEGILFHLGPGNKQFYTWDDPKHNKIAHNTQVFHNIEQMLPMAKCYELKPGDAMLIPHRVYHIANTSEFSVSFVMDYVNAPTDRFENDLLKDTSKEKITINNKYQIPLKINSPRSEWKKQLNHKSIQQKIELAFERKILALKSNGGILRKSKIKSGFQFPNGSFSIKGKPIFPMFVEIQSTDKDLIFARGHRIVKKHHPKLVEIIEGLNKGKSIKLETIKETLLPSWDLIELLGFIGELLQIEAIVIDNKE
ncbi:RNA methylase [Polaribacter sp.]|uniref:RNA methylase n=1 Tax=Polaribacter sp. TaxID=1920175 RepID=UPI003EF38848